ncbi:MAG: tetratricopeptide repeat protein [Kiritimatiellae bacterium]|nr:tetratricopeptide repeat protein [Kiritimatiellia bacterium]HOU21092.1 tetratricopeptide repeat protein [Kiritimatiellia bacterium]HPC19491.1 tetratricopeptide repeat protein [Kiritimatiellia bacterium]HQQ59902.1 tetratricopeptide repeat protein [Kiritimatiellia bacterium]
MPASRPRSPATPGACHCPEPESAQAQELAFLEGVRARLPRNPAVLASLGHLYTELGRFQDGLRADREMVKLEPRSAIAWYNLACSLALTGQPDEAFACLDKAQSLGFEDAEGLQADEDLASLRTDPRFAWLLGRLAAGEA